METHEDILKLALALPPEERAALTDALLKSLDTEVDDDAAALWKDEIEKRIADLDAGLVVSVEATPILDALRGSLRAGDVRDYRRYLKEKFRAPTP